MKNPDEQAAEDLARYLDSRAPDDATRLDDDVAEALFAIRPDLAPAPRLTADDVLASVRRGPLAPAEVLSNTPLSMRSSEGAVVPFPGTDEDEEPSSETADATAPTPEPEPEPGTRGPFGGGTSGWGLLLAAAATLFIVARPALHEAAQEEPAPSRPALAEEAVEAAPPSDRSVGAPEADAREVSGRTPGDPAGGKEKASAEVGRATAPSPRPAPEPARSAKPAPPADDAAGNFAGAEDAEVRTRSVDALRERPPPAEVAEEERAELSNGDFIAELPAGRSSRPGGSEEPADLDELRALARPSDVVPEAWREGLTPARQAVIDETLAAAEAARQANDPVLAGELVSSLATRPPARAAQHLAAIAARDFLAGRAPGRAEAVAREALPLGLEATPERSRLLYVLGLALEARGAEAAAAEAFRSAIEANAAR